MDIENARWTQLKAAASWMGKVILEQGNAALQWATQIQVPILDDKPLIEPEPIDWNSMDGAGGDDAVDNSGVGIYNPYRNDLVNWLED
jgi:hypothetical protein